jgi:hypothetical protein
MFEMPGLQSTGDVKKDLDQVRRWLARFVPQLEQTLDNLGTDNFTTAYNERLEGLTTLTSAGQQKTTSAAMAEHLLDTNNPHQVTLNQLGYQPPQMQVEEKNSTIILTVSGLMIEIMPVDIAAGTATADGNVFKRTVSMGNWEQEFGALYIAMAVPYSGNIWLGTRSSADSISAGDATIYSAAAAQEAARIYMIGIGRG